MIIEMKFKIVVNEEIYAIIKNKISSMDESNHATVMEVMLNLYENDTIDTIYWKFDDESYAKKYHNSFLDIYIEVVHSDGDWNPEVFMFDYRNNMWRGSMNIRNNSYFKKLLNKTNILNKN